MKTRKRVADRIQISDRGYLQRKKLNHQDSDDDCNQRTGNFLKNIRSKDQNRKTYNANDQGIGIYGRNILDKGFHFLRCLDWFYTIRISNSEKIFQLADHDGHSDSGSKTGRNGIWNKFNQTAEVEQSHQNKKYTRHYSGNDKSIHSVTCYDTGYDGCKCSSRSGNLYAASAKS